MKTLLHLFTALLCTSAAMADVARPVLQSSTTKALVDDLATGAKKMTISATGTLEWVNGGTLSGASYFRTAAGLGIGVNVQAYDADLTTYAGITPSANVQTLLGASNYAAFKTSLSLNNVENTALSTWAGSANVTTLGTITTGVWHGTAIGLDYLASGGAADGQLLGFSDGAWVPVTLDLGLTVGTTGIAGGTSGRLLYNNAGILGELALGTNVATLLGTPSSANLAAAITDETGTGKVVFGTSPTFTTSIIVNKTGQTEVGGLEVADDPAAPSVRALFILPPDNGNRIYVGKSGQAAYSVNFVNCSAIENVPAFYTASGFYIGGAGVLYINRGSGGTEIGANHPTGYGLDVFQDNSWATADLTHRAVNIHRTDGLTLFGTSTTRTNFEALNLSWDGTQYLIKPVAGSGGGTVRTVRYHTTGSVFFASGSGSPESVVTAPVGSLYTRTDGGAGTTLYVKESGSGNTGWIAK